MPTTRAVNGHALSADVTVTASDVGLANVTNVAQLPASYLSTDGTFASNSDVLVPSQKAAKTYVDNGLTAKADTTALTTGLAAKAADNAVVHLAGTESVTGVKTFTSSVTVNSDVKTTGQITAGSGNNTVTTAAGLLDATKLAGNLPAVSGAALTGLTATQVGLANVTNVAQLPASYLSTDGTFVSNSDTLVPSQKAAKTYTDSALSSKVPTSRAVNGHALSADVTVTASDVGLANVTNVAQLPASYLSTDGTFASNSDVLVPSQKAAKTYVDTGLSAKVATNRTVNGHALSADVTVTASDVGLANVTNVAQLPASYLSTDGTFASNSDALVPSQKAARTYTDTKDSAVVHLAGGEYITGVKTFTSSVTISNDLKTTGVITAGSGANAITTAAGLLDATKLSGNMPAVNGASLTGLTATQVGLGNVSNVAQLPASYLSTDGTFASNSDVLVPSQKAAKTYTDTGLSAKVPTTRAVNGHALSADVTVTAGDVGLANVSNVAQLPASYLSTDGAFASNSDVLVPSQKAAKTYTDSALAAKAADNAVVHLSGTESVTGSKTFSSSVTINSDLKTTGQITAGSGNNVITTAAGLLDATKLTGNLPAVNGASLTGLTATQVGLSNITNVAQLPASYLDTDTTLSANSDAKVPSQKAVKAYMDTGLSAKADTTALTTGLAGKLSNTATVPAALISLSTITTALATKLDTNGNGSSLTGITATQVGLGNVTNVAQMPSSYLNTDGTLSLNSDVLVPSQKAVKTYVDTGLAAKADTTALTTGLAGKLSNTAAVPQALINLSTVTTALALKLDTNGNGSSLTGLTATQVGLANVLNVAQMPSSYLNTDGTFSSNSDALVPSQKAAKTYVDTGLAAKADTTALTTGLAGKLSNTAAVPQALINLSTITTALATKLDTNGNGSSLTGLTATQVGLGNVTNVGQLPLSYLNTDGTLSSNSDVLVPSQKAAKTYADTKDAAAVHLAGGESITGVKTFTSSVTVNSDLKTTGQITAGSGSNIITTAAGLLDATKLTGNLPAISGASLTGLTATQVGLANVTNVAQLPASYLSIDGTFASNSDVLVPSQKAVKTYTDAGLAAKAADSAVVHLAGTESVTGAKTFSSILTVNNDFKTTGIITAGSGNNVLTTAAGLLSAGKLTGNLPALDGSAITNLGVFNDAKVYTSNNTWSPTTGTNHIYVQVVGGGGGGGSAYTGTTTGQSTVGGGAGGGGCSMSHLAVSAVSYPTTVTVGGGGAGGAVTANLPGAPGGASSFGTYVAASGGTGGVMGMTAAATVLLSSGATAGVGTIGDILMEGGGGGLAMRYSGAVAVAGAGGMACGGGGGTAGPVAVAGSGVAGNTGASYGGGGSGGAAATNSTTRKTAAGGNGAGGVVIVWEYK